MFFTGTDLGLKQQPESQSVWPSPVRRMFPSGKPHVFHRRSSPPLSTMLFRGCKSKLQEKRKAGYVLYQFHLIEIQKIHLTRGNRPRNLILDGLSKQWCFLSSWELKIRAVEMSCCCCWRKKTMTDFCETRIVFTLLKFHLTLKQCFEKLC